MRLVILVVGFDLGASSLARLLTPLTYRGPCELGMSIWSPVHVPLELVSLATSGLQVAELSRRHSVAEVLQGLLVVRLRVVDQHLRPRRRLILKFEWIHLPQQVLCGILGLA